MSQQKRLNRQRLRRRRHVRRRIRGDAERPRLTVFRSNKNMAAQLIDDDQGRTLAAASTREGDIRSETKYGGNKAAAEVVGRTLAERAIAAGIKKVKFDRREYKYHGRIAALADAARAAGLDF